MSDASLESGLFALRFARQTTMSLLEDIPEDQYCFQPIPKANHALWIVGHLAYADDAFHNMMPGRGSALPESWDTMFGMGSTPSSDASAYPSVGEMKERLTSSRDAVIEWFKSMDAETLQAPLPEDYQSFAPTHAGLAATLAWHEGLHAGQLTVIRKALGRAPIMG